MANEDRRTLGLLQVPGVLSRLAVNKLDLLLLMKALYCFQVFQPVEFVNFIEKL
jgi:hypothetical protein